MISDSVEMTTFYIATATAKAAAETPHETYRAAAQHEASGRNLKAPVLYLIYPFHLMTMRCCVTLRETVLHATIQKDSS